MEAAETEREASGLTPRDEPLRVSGQHVHGVLYFEDGVDSIWPLAGCGERARRRGRHSGLAPRSRLRHRWLLPAEAGLPGREVAVGAGGGSLKGRVMNYFWTL